MTARTLVLGINAFHGDASAALVADGVVLAAVAEERLSRVKHAAGFPARAVREVMAQVGARATDLAAIAVGRDGRAHLGRKLVHLIGTRPSLRTAVWPRLRARRELRNIRHHVAEALDLDPTALDACPLHNWEHHRAHAASAYYGSGYPDAAVLTVDGFGDFVSTAWGVGNHDDLHLVGRVFFPHSLGVLYQAVTQFCGFPHYGDEGKLMGLAPFGSPRFVNALGRMIELHPDGTFRLRQEWFRHARGGVGTSWTSESPEVGPLWSERWVDLFGPAQRPRSDPTERERDLAASAQVLVEQALFHLIAKAVDPLGKSRLALAGGVALNCVFNGKLVRRTRYAENYVFPAAGDDGLAVGAAWLSDRYLRRARPVAVAVPLWGRKWSDAADRVDRAALLARGCVVAELGDDIFARAASALAAGWIVGWFRGSMEFGPRALGARSILADPRATDIKDRLNRRIKHREPFRPFAPAVLLEHARDWFEDIVPSPAMLHAVPVRADKRGLLPAVTHVDGSARVQTVSAAEHPDFARLLKEFARLTGVPVLLNTSFNDNEPIVHTPAQAVDCFLRTDMDALAIEGLWIERGPSQQGQMPFGGNAPSC